MSAQTSTPILYDYWRSSASYRLRIALNLKGIAYQPHFIDLLRKEHRTPEHLARNPQGLVPVLAIDGLLLSQSLAIMEYLEETRPAIPLLPGDAAGRARVRALTQAIAIEIHPICNLRVVDRVVALADGGEAMKTAWNQYYLAAGLDAVERLLEVPESGRFCHGDQPGLGDCCLVPQLYNARRWGVDLSPWPRIRAIEAACAELAAFQAAHPDKVRQAGI